MPECLDSWKPKFPTLLPNLGPLRAGPGGLISLAACSGCSGGAGVCQRAGQGSQTLARAPLDPSTFLAAVLLRRKSHPLARVAAATLSSCRLVLESYGDRLSLLAVRRGLRRPPPEKLQVWNWGLQGSLPCPGPARAALWEGSMDPIAASC